VRTAAIDYDHYISKQLQPIADAILPFVLSRTLDLSAQDQFSFDF
jgi:DNA polymerase-2